MDTVIGSIKITKSAWILKSKIFAILTVRGCVGSTDQGSLTLPHLSAYEVVYLRKKPTQRNAEQEQARKKLSLWIEPCLISFPDF